MGEYFVYILASKRNGTLYVGVTSNPAKRVHDHKEGAAESFTRQHNVKLLVHLEVFRNLDDARRRELQLKRWRRKWKLDLIEEHNPRWRDLYADLNT